MTGQRRFTVQGTNNAFTCVHCGAEVKPLHNGPVRNHCPVCLYSLHVDVQPGDRANDCRGPMAPRYSIRAAILAHPPALARMDVCGV